MKQALEPKVFNCHLCKTELGKSKRLVGKTMRKRTTRGCFDYTTKTYQIENIVYKSCIGNFAKNLGFLIDSFHKYESSMLPFNGTLGEQPNKIIEIFDIIRHQIAEHQKRQEKK